MKTVLLPLIFSALALSAEPRQLFPAELEHWKMAGPGKFAVEGEVATARGGMGLWWFSEEQFQNASLSLEFKLDDPKQNSGIFVRFPDPKNDPWIAVKQGYEIQISGRGVDKKSTGSIYDIQAPIANPLKKNGAWNKMDVHVLDDVITVILNDKIINIFTPEKGRGDKNGYFGIQNHDDESPVQFRNITVTPLPNNQRLYNLLPRDKVTSYNFKRKRISSKNKRKSNAKNKHHWFNSADFGPAFVQTWADFHEGEYRSDAGLKGILIRPNPKQHDLVTLFNMETLQWVTATNQGVILDNTPFRGKHGTQNKIMNLESSFFNTDLGPAWAHEDGSFDDNREHPGHGNYEHLKFRGYYRHGHEIILDYLVHGTPVLEKIVEENGQLRRIFQIQGHEGTYRTKLSSLPLEESSTNHESLTTKTGPEGTFWEFTQSAEEVVGIDYQSDGQMKPALNEISGLQEQIKGGPPLYPETFKVSPKLATGNQALLVEQIPLPPVLDESPYKNKIRITDLDFFADGDRAAVCTWGGDVWLLSGLNEFKTITWKRFASGLFEPLGLKIVNDIIHLNCRDGIWQVIDLNNDNEADHFKVFNNDVLITDNFHEFSFGLETDADGYFYFTKGSSVRPGGRKFDKMLPHNGTVLKLSPDGEKLSVIATGIRAPGGIGVGPNGEITTGENEGTWQPACKINYFTIAQQPVFLGTEQARQGLEKDFHEPLCYLPMNVDNSGGSQIWVPEGSKIGLKPGELLHLSYGQSSIYRVLPQKLADGQLQGGVVKLPIKLSSSAQRAVFHQDGSLYVSGMRGWQTNAASEAGIQRIRYNEGKLLGLPEAMTVSSDKITLTFDGQLDEELATDLESFSIKRWKYIRGPRYGSGQFSIDNPDLAAEKNAILQESKSYKKQDKVEVSAAELSEDGKSIVLTIPTLKPAQQMQIDYDLETTDGEVLIGTIYSTIHKN